jgi:outer membrane lipoprotein SlyB
VAKFAAYRGALFPFRNAAAKEDAMRSYFRFTRALLCCLLVLCAALFACSGKKSDPYAVNTAYRIGGMETGTVSSVSETLITEEPGDNLVLGGAGAGGVSGLLVSGGSPLGGVLGAAAGAWAGDYYTGESTARFKALAITVAMDSGAMVIVVQEEDDVYLVGDRVRVLYERDRAQVRHY